MRQAGTTLKAARICATSSAFALWLCWITASAQSPTFRYFYDDAGELFRVLDSTGTLIEYDYDLSGNITQIQRSTVPPTSLTIFNIAPLSGPVGQTVTIYGQNFSASAVGDVVQFGGVTATVVSASSTALVVQIPPGFTSGVVTLTVNGVTVNGGPLTFIPPPAVTSISPNAGDSGQAITVTIQGLNLSGATFNIGSGGTVTTVTTSSTQATVTITPGSKLGPYTLVGMAPSGAMSSTVPSDATTFVVFYSPGNNTANAAFTVFNNVGSPSFPNGSSEADQAFTVYNTALSGGNFLAIPAGANEADQAFTVVNSLLSPGTVFSTPAGSNEADQTFTVLNTPVSPGNILSLPAGANEADGAFTVLNASATPGVSPSIPAGSNEAWQLFSTQNGQSGSSPMSLGIPVGQGVRATLAAATGDARQQTGEPLSLIAGQTVQITLQPSQFLPYLELDADTEPLAIATVGSLSVPFTAPFGVTLLRLQGFGRTSSGSLTDPTIQEVRLMADPGRTVSGRVIDANGAPIAGETVTWQANGLTAEYYRLNVEASGIPEIRGAPARESFVSALNYPNPRQVFGMDPMGVGLAGSYAMRLSGNIRIDIPGTYSFELVAHRGARLTIDGRVVAEAVALGIDAAIAEGSANLTAGRHEIEVIEFESGGAAALQLLWIPPGGSQSVVPPSAITSDAPRSSRSITDGAGRFALQVPAALDGLMVKVLTGNGSVQVDQ